MKDSEEFTDKCLICNKNSCNDLHDVFNTRSKHSNTYLYVFIERFTKLNVRDLGKSEICDMCVEELNSFDSAEMKCLRIQDEILKLFNDTLKDSLKCEFENSDEFTDRFYVEADGSSENEDCTDIQKLEVEPKDEELEMEQPPEKFDSNLCMALNSTEADEEDLNKYDRKKVKIERKVRVKREQVPHECEICQKQFKTKAQLKSHAFSHTDVRPYVCELCGQAYRHKGALQVHIIMHSGLSPYQCLTCGKQFTQKGALKRHGNIHSGIPKHQCEQCGKQFIHRTSFQMHILAHSNIRDYTCSTCGLALRSSSHLNRHKRTHSGERKHPCEICGKSFVERYNLLAHMRTHEDQSKPNSNSKHQCPICFLNFQRRRKLEDHLKNAHNTIPNQNAPNSDAALLPMAKLEDHLKNSLNQNAPNEDVLSMSLQTEPYTNLRIVQPLPIPLQSEPNLSLDCSDCSVKLEC